VKLEADEGGMGDHDDLLKCQNNLQLRRLHEQSQAWDQLDEVIEEIRRLMLGSAQIASEERLSIREVAAAAQKQQEDGADE
jgi:hypothetical protein